MVETQLWHVDADYKRAVSIPSKNSHFFVSARKRRADDCMGAAVRRPEGRTMHGAIVENRSVHEVHEDSSTELTQQSRKSAFLEMPYRSILGSIRSLMLV
jgi:hypothetical protein